MQLTFEIEDSLQEIIDSIGARQAIEQAVHRTIMTLKQDFYERASRAPSASSFRGAEKV
jgi:hypothetical protein